MGEDAIAFCAVCDMIKLPNGFDQSSPFPWAGCSQDCPGYSSEPKPPRQWAREKE